MAVDKYIRRVLTNIAQSAGIKSEWRKTRTGAKRLHLMLPNGSRFHTGNDDSEFFMADLLSEWIYEAPGSMPLTHDGAAQLEDFFHGIAITFEKRYENI